MKAIRIIAILAVASGCSLAFAAVNLPSQKLGSWESSSSSNLHPGTSMRTRMCFAAGTEGELKAKGEAAGKQYHCTTTDPARQGDTYTYEGSCQVGPHATKTTTVVTFQGDAAYHSVSTTDRGDGKPASVFTTDSHWVGPCQPGQVAGEGESIK